MKNNAAFPSEYEWGLTKREYFAGLALQGILANPRFTENTEKSNTNLLGWASNRAVEHADQLLKELENER